MDAGEISAWFSQQLGGELIVAIATEACELNTFSTAEQEQFATSRHPKHQAASLLGRTALKQLLIQLNLPTDTSAIHFPHPQLSLSHCGNLAIAVGSVQKPNEPKVHGLGVDVLHNRVPNPGSERFYLTAGEQAWLQQQPEVDINQHRQRLWTVKEAVFKANLDNANHRLYTTYSLTSLETPTGNATDGAGKSYRYASRYFSSHNTWVTVALAQPSNETRP